MKSAPPSPGKGVRIGLIGYGRMGMEVERAAKERGATIAAVFTDKNNPGGEGLTRESLKAVDVCIDFSTPSSVMENIDAVTKCGKNLVVGTTGWYDKLDTVRRLVKDRKTGFLYAPNFSLGLNIFTQILMDAAHLFDRYPEYDASIHEVHHSGKADSPSGTALSLGSTILKMMKRKSELLSGPVHDGIKQNQLQISSTRVGHVTGRHAVMFDSEFDTVELIHTAKSRRGFALGAVIAAEWLKGKKGFYTMRDVILP